MCIACNQVRNKFKWDMQGHKFTTDVFLILLENYHLVLGVQWLATLDDSLWNFKSLSMKFLRGKELCELKVKK